MKKQVLTVLIAILLSTTIFSGCKATFFPPDDMIHAYFADIKAGRYQSAYDRLSVAAMGKISFENFEKKHKSIWNDLKITNQIISDENFETTNVLCTYTYTSAYESELFGTYSEPQTMTLIKVESKWSIEWKPSYIFVNLENDDDKVVLTKLSPKRGEIFAGDELVAKNIIGTTVYADPAKIEDSAAFVHQIAPFINKSTDFIKKAIDGKNYLVTLNSFLPDDLPKSVENSILAIPGAGIDKTSFTTFRYYPFSESMFHVVGYLGKISEKQLDSYKGTPKEALYNSDSLVGVSGVESKYEDVLRGSDGYTIYIANQEGTRKQTIFTNPAEDGLDIHLSIDPDLQVLSYELLKSYLRNEQTGSIVTVDPLTGGVTCMTNYPSVDPNKMMKGISEQEWLLMNDPITTPLVNRATQGLYVPGSIFKPLTGAMALDEGVISPNSRFDGEINDDRWIPNRSDWVYPAIKRVENKSGVCDFENAIVWSDNIFFAWSNMKLGEENFFKHCRNLGFEEQIPFDLSVAKSSIKNSKTEFNIKYLADSGYGQGELLVTPLHSALMYCAFANNGTIMRPYLVKSMYKSTEFTYEPTFVEEGSVWKENVFSSDSIRTLTSMMEGVMERGTGRSAHAPYKVAGKTGTAEKSKVRDISWLSFYRSESPNNFALSITLDTPTGMGSIKTDIVASILRYDNQLRQNTQGDQ